MRIDSTLLQTGALSSASNQSASGPIVHFYDVEEQLSAAILRDLGYTESDLKARGLWQAVQTPQTTNYDAFVAFSRGLDAKDHQDYASTGPGCGSRERFSIGGNAFGQAFLGQTFKACGSAKSIKHAFTISGTVISGPPSNKKPIRSSEVTLYEAATPSDIPQDNLPGCAVASTRTNLRGQFEMKFSNSPNPAAVLYLVAAGGNAGHGSNPNIKLMSVIKIGSVSNDDGSAITPIGTISATVNELTTAASAYVYSNFISDETEIRLIQSAS